MTSPLARPGSAIASGIEARVVLHAVPAGTGPTQTVPSAACAGAAARRGRAGTRRAPRRATGRRIPANVTRTRQAPASARLGHAPELHLRRSRVHVADRVD